MAVLKRKVWLFCYLMFCLAEGLVTFCLNTVFLSIMFPILVDKPVTFCFINQTESAENVEQCPSKLNIIQATFFIYFFQRPFCFDGTAKGDFWRIGGVLCVSGTVWGVGVVAGGSN